MIDRHDPILNVGYALFSKDNTLLYWSYHSDTEEKTWPKIGEGKFAIRSKLPDLNDKAGRITP